MAVGRRAVNGNSDKSFTAEMAAELVHSLFKDREGKISPVRAREIFMLSRWGRETSALLIPSGLKLGLPCRKLHVTVSGTNTPKVSGNLLEILIRIGVFPDSSSQYPPAGAKMSCWWQMTTCYASAVKKAPPHRPPVA